MEERNFDFLLTQNQAGQHVAVVDGEEFTPYLVVNGKRYAVDDLLALIPANDLALDWADRDLKWSPISTAPRDGTRFRVKFNEQQLDNCFATDMGAICLYRDYPQVPVILDPVPTHWMPTQNPPLGQLPAPLEALGAVLRRVKNV